MHHFSEVFLIIIMNIKATAHQSLMPSKLTTNMIYVIASLIVTTSEP